MKNSHKEVVENADGSSFRAYVSEPTNPNGHAVIVLQEIFGVTAHIKRVADQFAEDGFIAYAPDLFWRMHPGVELTHSEQDMQKAFSFLGQYKDEDGIKDIAQTVAHIRQRTGFTGKIAAVGLCLGGKLAYLASTLPGIDASVSFYGVGIENCLDAAGAIRCPLMLHFGDQDPYVNDQVRQQIMNALTSKAVQSHLYPGANHGFYTRGEPADIDLARQRTNAFLKSVLNK
ncbi:dienelactone hydrolase family protein [Limnohabitans sp. Rim8]|uniref:dienelactone hydrolase family protein n=1 Tax=Limnohabitans sp. Rim8 TaxID=1100718 RepID=UPI001304E8E4|nr:dienelactone hydrolase family protein [Limnohabitans sp. Rim8]